MQNVEIPFRHRHAAHCETGAMSALLAHAGLDLSEPMVFGTGAGLFFAFLPFVKLQGKFPLVAFRAQPGSIKKRICNELGIRFRDETFGRDADRAMAELDRALDQGIPVGLQTGVYWLPYMPGAMRFQFNGHNIIVYGREGDEYLVSDPVLHDVVRCRRDDLVRARFSEGDMAPRGRMYYPVQVPTSVDLVGPVRRGMAKTTFNMLKIPVPFLGVRGIRKLSGVVRAWPRKLSAADAAMQIGHLVLLLEEIGTGGAGFRFMYGGFLQDAAGVLGDPGFADAGRAMIAAGDKWREFALLASRTCKGRATVQDPYDRLADLLLECAEGEAAVYRQVRERLATKPAPSAGAAG